MSEDIAALASQFRMIAALCEFLAEDARKALEAGDASVAPRLRDDLDGFLRNYGYARTPMP